MKKIAKPTIALGTVAALSMTTMTAFALHAAKREAYARTAEDCFKGGRYTRAVKQTAGSHEGEYRCFECITFNPNKPNDPPRFPIDKLKLLALKIRDAKAGQKVGIATEFGELSATKPTGNQKVVAVRNGLGMSEVELQDGTEISFGLVVDAPSERITPPMQDTCIFRPNFPNKPKPKFSQVIATPLGEVIAGSGKDAKEVYVNAELLREEYGNYRSAKSRGKALTYAEFESAFRSLLSGAGSEAERLNWPIKKSTVYCKQHRTNETAYKWVGF